MAKPLSIKTAGDDKAAKTIHDTGVRANNVKPAAAKIRTAYRDAMADPDATRVVLKSEDGTQRAVAVVEPGGLGVISLRELADLGPDRTYQLWGVIDDQVISLGVLGHRPAVEPFTVDGNLTALVVTEEAAGGVPTSQQPALLKGTVA